MRAGSPDYNQVLQKVIQGANKKRLAEKQKLELTELSTIQAKRLGN